MLDRLLQRKVEYQLISACSRAFHRCECETTVVVFRDQVMIRAFLVPLDFPYRVGRNLLEDVKEIPKDSVNRRIVFRFDCVDLEADCPWSLAHMSDEEHRLLLLKMRDFEKATVGEIISPSYQAFTCYPDFTQCPNQTPQDRLAKYYEREGDALARFRLGGTERLYGFLVGNEFHILWWDPNHEVWPSTRKHT